MTTTELIVNVVLAAFVVAAVVGSLAWSIAQSHRATVERLRTRMSRGEFSGADEQIGREYAADRGLVVG